MCVLQADPSVLEMDLSDSSFLKDIVLSDETYFDGEMAYAEGILSGLRNEITHRDRLTGLYKEEKMAYSELIKSFHRIRPLMRSFYVYGFKHRLEHDEKSTRSYDNERRRIESWLGDYLKFGQDADGKRLFLSVDSRAIAENPLYQAFKAKSFTDKDIMLHFFLMDLLDTENGLCLNEIMDLLGEYLEEFYEIDFPDESSVRKKLKEYEGIGLVRKGKEGKKVLYYLVKDPVHTDTWTDALSFFTEAAPLGVVGSYIRDTNSCISPDPQGASGYFRFKHHYILNALDSEILCSLFEAMGEEKTVILHSEHICEEMIPLKIYISTQTGRQYILGKTLQGFRFFRLDLLDSVKKENPVEITEELREELAEFETKVWGVSRKDAQKTEHLEFVIHAEAKENFIIQRLQREKRNGTVTDLGDGNWQYSTDVFDALEMLPWIRTFMGRIISLETDNWQVKKRFREELQALYQMYGGEENAVL